MLTKYRIKGRFKSANIEEVEVLRETEKFVFTLCREKEIGEGKNTEWAEYYDTWDAAHAALTKAANNSISNARRELELSKSFAGNVKGMRRASAVGAELSSNG